MRIPYFPGCTLSTKARGFDVAARASASALGIELDELPQWNCCGGTFPLAVDNELALVGPARVLIGAQEHSISNVPNEDARLVTLCAICYNVLRRTAVFLRANEEKRERINLFIGSVEDRPEHAYKGEVQVLHLLEVLRDELGFDAVRGHVEKRRHLIGQPGESLRVAPYYGCLLLRPEREIGLDDPDEPTILHDLLSSLGCDVVDFPHKTECCGSYLTVSAAGAAKELAYTILDSAAREGAELLVTSCPLCQFNLDYRQREMSAEHTGFSPLPVLYFAQLMGLALGLESTDYGFEQHYVDPRPLLARKGLEVS